MSLHALDQEILAQPVSRSKLHILSPITIIAAPILMWDGAFVSYPYIIRLIYVQVNSYNTLICYDRLSIVAAGHVQVMDGSNTHEGHRR